MNAIVLSFCAALLSASPTVPANPVLTDLVEKGVAMPEGIVIKLPAPSMTDGLDAAGQAKVIAAVVATNKRLTVEKFMATDSSAPVVLPPIRKVVGASGEVTARAVDLWFVAHGDWATLNSEEFSNKILKARKQEDAKKGQTVSKVGFLTKEEAAARGLKPLAASGIEERYFYTTLALMSQVEVSVTRRAILTKTPTMILLATEVDPRFAADKEYPNQWRAMDRNVLAQIVFGKPHPYSGAGFYIKVTKLVEPTDGIFIEYHGAYNEPKGWFDGENTLRSQIPILAKHEVEQFRGNLARASMEGDSASKSEGAKK